MLASARPQCCTQRKQLHLQSPSSAYPPRTRNKSKRRTTNSTKPCESEPNPLLQTTFQVCFSQCPTLLHLPSELPEGHKPTQICLQRRHQLTAAPQEQRASKAVPPHQGFLGRHSPCCDCQQWDCRAAWAVLQAECLERAHQGKRLGGAGW